MHGLTLDMRILMYHPYQGAGQRKMFCLEGGGGGGSSPSQPPHKTTTGSKAGSWTPLCLAMCLASRQEVTKLSPSFFTMQLLGASTALLEPSPSSKLDNFLSCCIYDNKKIERIQLTVFCCLEYMQAFRLLKHTVSQDMGSKYIHNSHLHT